MKNADDNTKLDFEKFWRVIRKLWEKLDKIFKNKHTFQRNVFQTNFESTESSEKDSNIKNNQKTSRNAKELKFSFY